MADAGKLYAVTITLKDGQEFTIRVRAADMEDAEERLLDILVDPHNKFDVALAEALDDHVLQPHSVVHRSTSS